MKLATMYFRCGSFEFKIGGYDVMSPEYMRNWAIATDNQHKNSHYAPRHYNCKSIEDIKHQPSLEIAGLLPGTRSMLGAQFGDSNEQRSLRAA